MTPLELPQQQEPTCTEDAGPADARGVIIYLAQNRRHPLYGSSGRAKLERSLHLLYEHYNKQFGHDVRIFHEGDFDAKAQAEIIASRKEIQFDLLTVALWGAPPHIQTSQAASWHNAKFGVGYRNMCRLFAFLLHPHLRSLGYSYAMRIDDDGFLLSPITYNIFERMHTRGWRYAYRAVQFEAVRNALAWPEAVSSYVRARGLQPRQGFVRHCRPSGALNSCFTGVRNRTHPQHSIGWDGWTIYNNFYATELGWWSRPDVEAFRRHFDDLGGTYYYRWGDALLHTAAVQLFLDEEAVHRFVDFTYQHASIRENGSVLLWGGIFEGTDDPEGQKSLQIFRQMYGATLAPPY